MYEMKWYVFDQYDCFDAFPTAVEAAKLADELSDGQGLYGIHIARMTPDTFLEYCKTGVFPFTKGKSL